MTRYTVFAADLDPKTQTPLVGSNCFTILAGFPEKKANLQEHSASPPNSPLPRSSHPRSTRPLRKQRRLLVRSNGPPPDPDHSSFTGALIPDRNRRVIKRRPVVLYQNRGGGNHVSLNVNPVLGENVGNGDR